MDICLFCTCFILPFRLVWVVLVRRLFWNVGLRNAKTLLTRRLNQRYQPEIQLTDG